MVEREARLPTPQTWAVLMLNQVLRLHLFRPGSHLQQSTRVLISANGKRELQCPLNHRNRLSFPKQMKGKPGSINQLLESLAKCSGSCFEVSLYKQAYIHHYLALRSSGISMEGNTKLFKTHFFHFILVYKYLLEFPGKLKPHHSREHGTR